MGSAARLARAATVGNGQNPTSVRLACCTRALDAVFASCECHETDKSRELSGSRKYLHGFNFFFIALYTSAFLKWRWICAARNVCKRFNIREKCYEKDSTSVS